MDPNVIYALDAEGFQPTAEPLVFWKELIYVGDFVKETEDSKLKFSVNKGLLDHWEQTFKSYLANGNEVPLPLGHTTNPELRRGSVVELKQQKNKKGLDSLYGKVVFKDAKAAELAKTTNASILVEPSVTDGKGTVYKRPIVHAALTDYPVIPGLEPFQAIVASRIEEKKMTVVELAQKMGIDPNTPPDQMFDAIWAAFSKLKGGAPPGAPPGAPSGAPPMVKASDTPPTGQVAKDVTAETLAMSRNPQFVGMLRDNRRMRIEKLATGESARITPAVRKHLEDTYCKDDKLSLSLLGTDDGFDGVMATLELNEPVFRTGSRTGIQSPDQIALSHSQKPENNPLIKNAEDRAKAVA